MNNETFNDQQLLLYYYSDGLDASERQSLSVALQADKALAARYRELAAELDALGEEWLDETPATAPAHLQHQWHDLVSREAQFERKKQQPVRHRKRRLGWAGGLATALALGVAIGLWLQQPGQPSPELQAGPNEPGPNESGLVAVLPDPGPAVAGGTAFARAAQFYFDGQQAELAGMQDPASAANQLLLLQIIAQNRLIEKAAIANHAPDLARLIRAFEPVLFKLADPATTPEQAAALQRQLAFELQAVLTILQQAPSKPATVI